MKEVVETNLFIWWKYWHSPFANTPIFTSSCVLWYFILTLDSGQSPHTVKWLFYDGLARLLPQRFHTIPGPISQQILEYYCKRVIQSLLPTFPNMYHLWRLVAPSQELCRAPCVHMLKNGSCHLGFACDFCHFMHRKKKKLDKSQRNLLIEAEPGLTVTFWEFVFNEFKLKNRTEFLPGKPKIVTGPQSLA